MSEFSDAIYLNCNASVVCSVCGDVSDANGDTEGEAVRQLEKHLEKDGWECYDALVYCRDCLRKKEEEYAAKTAKRGRRRAE